ncbi:Diphthamide biosynthesis protein 3 [Protomyces lactucae-debilis]|uniref:Diphthamide biosynthesis protein 3 n=1 Tax=Protomyces lactucae-debilis TaxID=2754530 RepID=A0A1Y2FS90_PROLT|nr:Diphthamide biosynthesis protein 3 [Protomyces lactucae-debilis]ORY86863.1 Diphthamide biosynthesis protein 3 [Protomyces lactucae-debilis]
MSEGGFYDEVEIEDMSFDKEKNLYHFPCPCGDRFEITVEQLKEGDDIARCPSCSLIILVIYDQDDYLSDEEEEGVLIPTNEKVEALTAVAA